MLCTICCFVATIFFCGCKTTTYYIVRHAEKEASATMMGNDVPLSAAGMARARSLRDKLLPKNIQHLYSTSFRRTTGTALPLSDTLHLMIELYTPGDAAFITRLKEIRKGNSLIVGHSNTVDDLVNGLMGEKALPGDLPETQYGDLFIVIRKGKNYRLKKERF